MTARTKVDAPQPPKNEEAWGITTLFQKKKMFVYTEPILGQVTVDTKKYSGAHSRVATLIQANSSLA